MIYEVIQGEKNDQHLRSRDPLLDISHLYLKQKTLSLFLVRRHIIQSTDIRLQKYIDKIIQSKGKTLSYYVSGEFNNKNIKHQTLLRDKHWLQRKAACDWSINLYSKQYICSNLLFVLFKLVVVLIYLTVYLFTLISLYIDNSSKAFLNEITPSKL